METKQLTHLIRLIVIVWFIAGLILAGLTVGGVMSKAVFQYAFAGGFIVFVLIISVLSKMLYDQASK